MSEPAMRSDKPSIELNDQGFVLHTGSGDHVVHWNKVREIATYKVDYFTVDSICLAFTVDDDGNRIEVREEDCGFGDLMKRLDEQFEALPEWYYEVMFPPFATNYRVIWRRS